MRIYLVRHGKAAQEGYDVDAQRPLTSRGRTDAERIAVQMGNAGVSVHQIRHSGLVRAQQTADIFAQYLEPPGGVIQVAGLLFDDPVEGLADELHLEPEPVMLVGHNPFMERLASMLLTGNPNQTPIWFATSTTACFEYIEGEWSARWVLSRQIVP
ncbi:MAG: phosphohistidine phosphatase SixA [Anaerolineae bacterium]|nr:phosphohistidine phosphatase SixA [Anaerolineae bacterium]